MEVGDNVTWISINGPVSGVLKERLKNGSWLVSVGRYAVVMVNEKSFVNVEGR